MTVATGQRSSGFSSSADFMYKGVAIWNYALTKEHFVLFDFVTIPVNHMHMKGLVRDESIDTPEKMAVNLENRLENLLEQDLPLGKIGLAHLTVRHMFREGKVADVLHAMNENRCFAS